MAPQIFENMTFFSFALHFLPCYGMIFGMNSYKILTLGAAVLCAATASTTLADTWLWIGGSPNTYSGGKVGPGLGTARDWRDGYNWTNLTTNCRGSLYPDNSVCPGNGDIIIFDGAVKSEYTHCFEPSSGAYGGVVYTNLFGGSYGSHVPIQNGGFVRYATSGTKVENQSYQCSGTFEFYVASPLYVSAHFNNGAGTVRKTGAGELRVGAPNGNYRTNTLRLEEGTLGCYKAPDATAGEALNSLRNLIFAGNDITVNLMGLNQTSAMRVTEENGVTGHQITSAKPACLTLAGAQDNTTFSGKVSDKASLCWNPTDGEKTLTLSGGACDTTGTLIVSNGVLEIAAGTTFSAAKFDAEGGQFKFMSKAALASGSVTVDGAVVDDGFYTGTGLLGRQVSWLAGDQLVMIGAGGESGDTVEATWNGTGNLTTVANWQGAAELPPIGAGSVKMLVAGGTAATVDQNSWIRGVEIGSDVTAFSFAGSSPLWLGSLGLTTPGVGGSYAIGAPLGLTTAQAWTVGAGDNLTVAVGLQTVADGAVTLDGSGTVTVTTSQPELANNIRVLRGKLVVTADGGLGTGETFVNTTNGVLDLQAMRYDGAITATGGGAWGAWGIQASRDYLFNGCVTRQVGALDVTPGAGKTWTFAGGFNLGPSTTHNLNGGGTIVITNQPFKGGFSSRVNFTKGKFHLYTIGNDINSGQQGWIVGETTTLYTHVPYAINGGHFNIAGNQGNYGTWDLCGCDQKVDSIQCGRGNNRGEGAEAWKKGTAPGTVASEKPALLHDASTSYRINPSNGSSPSSTNWAYFVGQAGLSKDGSYKGLWLNQTCMSSGTVQVTNQKLYFSKRYIDAAGNDYGTGSWPNAARVVAKGTGTLVFEHSKAIGKKTDVIIEENGKVQLDAGVDQKCANLYFGNEKQALGTWGSPESAATYKDARFTGTGILTVRGERPGILLIFR